MAFVSMYFETPTLLSRHDSYMPIMSVVPGISRLVGNHVATANEVTKLVKGLLRPFRSR